jgi:hypothetical protein
MQIGEIGGERHVFDQCAVGLVARRRQIGRLALARPLAGLAENPGAKLNLRVRFQNFLAGAQGFRAAEIALDEIDEFIVEIAIVHRGNERERGDEHRKVDDDRLADVALAFAYHRLIALTPPSSPGSRSMS